MNSAGSTIKSRVLPFIGGMIAGWLAVLAVVALVAWGIISSIAGLKSDDDSFPGYRTFDSAIWLDQELTEYDPDWPPRLCMVDSLLKSRELNGLTREQVVDLLGQPGGTESKPIAGELSIYYFLGPERSAIRIDSEWLSISFSEDDAVIRAWLWND